MKKGVVWALSSIIFISILIVVITTFVFTGRRKIYPLNTQGVSKYGGASQVYIDHLDQAFINPEGEEAFFVPPDQVYLYEKPGFEISQIPAQKELLFATGTVLGWQRINNSNDYYLNVFHRPFKITKYRIIFDKKIEEELTNTVLAVENLDPHSREESNNITKPKKSRVNEIGIETLRLHILPGDTAVIIAQQKIPQLIRKDERGNIISDILIIRRKGGINTWNQEIQYD